MRRIVLLCLCLFVLFSWPTSAQNFVAIPATFYGDPFAVLTGIGGSITMSRSSGNLPAFVHVSASGITASGGTIYNGLGTALAAQPALRPYERLEYIWNFGDPNGTEIFNNPVTGATVNANNAQIGPEAAYVYRVAGTYTITLQVIGLSAFGGNSVLLNTFTATFTASDPGNTKFYYDSNAVGGGNGTQGSPFSSLCNNTGPITTGCLLNTSNVSVLLACGSNFTADHVSVLSLNKGGGLTGVRIGEWSNGTTCSPTSTPCASSNMPKLTMLTTGTQPSAATPVVVFTSGNDKTDIVLSNLHVITDPTIGAVGGITPITFNRGQGHQTNDIYFDNDCGDNQSLSPGGAISIFVGDNTESTNIQTDPAAMAERMGRWGGTYQVTNASNNTTSSVVAFGAVLWQFDVGFGTSDYGSSSSALNHIVNPETSCQHYLFRWNSTYGGPGWNEIVHPRCGAWGATQFTATATSGSAVLTSVSGITGTVNVNDYVGQAISGASAIPDGNFVASCSPNCASPTSITMGNASVSPNATGTATGLFSSAASSLWTGGYVDIADNSLLVTPTLPLVTGIGQGIGLDNEGGASPANLNPKKAGFYNGVVIERNVIGGVSHNVIFSGGVTYITIRDMIFGAANVRGAGAYTFGGVGIDPVNSGTAPDSSSVAYAIYRNKVLRDDSVSGTTPGAQNAPIIGWFLDGTLSPASFGQEFGYNQLCDERASSSNTSSVQMAQSTMPTTAQTSVFDWNTYWAPNATGAPSNPTIFLSTVGASNPNEAFATYQAASPIFDPNGSITKPGFCSP